MAGGSQSAVDSVRGYVLRANADNIEVGSLCLLPMYVCAYICVYLCIRQRAREGRVVFE